MNITRSVLVRGGTEVTNVILRLSENSPAAQREANLVRQAFVLLKISGYKMLNKVFTPSVYSH